MEITLDFEQNTWESFFETFEDFDSEELEYDDMTAGDAWGNCGNYM
jgi:hypothetical protein